MGGLEKGALNKWAPGWKAAKVGQVKGQEEITRERHYLDNFHCSENSLHGLSSCGLFLKD